MPKLQGFNSLKAKLKRLGAKAQDANAVVVVGFSQRYAIFVHERTDLHHDVGQAKFLEQPARTLQPELAGIIEKVYRKTGDMRQALLMAGLRLQRAAQELTPVDTSALKASAYTAEEEKADQAATEAFNRSEQIRLSRSR